MTYDLLRNAKCLDGYPRCKYTKLGRTGASQSSHAIDELGRAFGWGQNNDYEAGVGDFQYIAPSTFGRPELVLIEYATQINVPGRCIKICSGEYASAAINDRGELYGWGTSMNSTSIVNNCASFALPHDSGVSPTEWSGSPVANQRNRFPTPTRMAPGYTFKDFSFDMYHATAIGMDNKLYTWGYDSQDGALGLGPGIDEIIVPTINPTLTADIKLLDSELFSSSAVTVDDRVYYWGTWWGWLAGVYVPTEITGLVIPPGETIVQLSNDYYNGVVVLLSNGELWGAGSYFLFGDKGVTGNSLTFTQITCFANPIVHVRLTALGSSAMVVIDDQGDIYGWSDGIDYFVGNDPTPSPDWEFPNLIAAEYAGQRKFVDVVLNTHNSVFQAIDDQGYLWTWGQQNWGPHLAIGATGYQAEADIDPDIDDVVYRRAVAGYASFAIDYQGDHTTHNALPTGESEYWQPIPQDRAHKPCGHWHLRTFFEEELFPQNCWMPSLAIDDNILLFVATGRWAKEFPGTGNEILMFTYDIDANIWTNIMYESAVHAANEPGGAAIDSDIYAFANWKADQDGALFNEVYSNFGIGVWVVDAAGNMEHADFLDSSPYMYMANKVAVYAGGVVAVAYTDSGGDLLVRVSTDYGATWALRKTVGVSALRKDFSLVIDKNTGYIFLAHQTTATSVMVERSIDNGLNWTTRTTGNYLMSGLLRLKLVSDGTMLFLIGTSLTSQAIERSSNEGSGWSTISGEPGDSVIASGCNVVDDHSDIAFVVVDDDVATFMNYIWDETYGGYIWLERDVSHLDAEGTDLIVRVGSEHSSMAGYVGRFAYSSFNFHVAPDPFIAVLITNDRGVTWDVRYTPLGYYESGEFTDFRGCPLFCLTEVPHLNHIWKFEKSTWAADFVKQKDKYVPVIHCACPEKCP